MKTAIITTFSILAGGFVVYTLVKSSQPKEEEKSSENQEVGNQGIGFFEKHTPSKIKPHTQLLEI